MPGRMGTFPLPSSKFRRLSVKFCANTSRRSVSSKDFFYAQNLQTAIIMGEARGAAIAAVAEAGLEIFEIAPRKVKQAVVGYGAAQKSAVAKWSNEC